MMSLIGSFLLLTIGFVLGGPTFILYKEEIIGFSALSIVFLRFIKIAIKINQSDKKTL